MPNLPSAETYTESPIWRHSWRWLASYWYRLITLNSYHRGRSRGLFFLEQTFSLDTNLSPLQAVLLAKQYSWISECHIYHMVSHTALLVIKQFTSQKTKCRSGPMFMKFTGLTVLSLILKQLVLQKGNVTFSSCSYRVSKVAITCGFSATFSRSCTCSESASIIWCCSSHSQDPCVQKLPNRNGSRMIHYYLWRSTCNIFASCSHNLMSWGSRRFPKGGMLPQETQKWFHWAGSWDSHPAPSAAHASESTDKGKGYCSVWGDWSLSSGGNWSATTQW